MKKTSSVFFVLASLLVSVGCNKISYKKTKSGLAYVIYPGNSKDSLIRDGNVIKMQLIQKLNDSVIYNTYNETPAFWQYYKSERSSYNLMEVLPMMRNGDSAVTVQLIDTLMAKGVQQLPPGAKKGDRIVTEFRIIHVFTVDSLAQADFMEGQAALREKKYITQDAEWEKSGEIAKGINEMEAYLRAKNIIAQKTGKGTYVTIQQQGTGPQAEKGKYVKVKYNGRLVETDSTFDSGVYPFKLGSYEVIRGWEEGLLLFKQGGKGVLYVPGFLAYGNNPGSAFKPFAAMKFDVELLEVSDKPIKP